MMGWEIMAVENPKHHWLALVLLIVVCFAVAGLGGLPWLIYAARHSDQQTADLARRFIQAWFSPPLCNRV
jgi:hypothetical protein